MVVNNRPVGIIQRILLSIFPTHVRVDHVGGLKIRSEYKVVNSRTYLIKQQIVFDSPVLANSNHEVRISIASAWFLCELDESNLRISKILLEILLRRFRLERWTKK